MRTLSLLLLLSLIFFLLPVLAASSPSTELLALVTEAYITAVVEKDAERLVQASVDAWKPDARLELDAFAGVETRVEGLACSVVGVAGGMASVTCRGAIVASDENGDRYYPLSGRVFRLEQEGGM